MGWVFVLIMLIVDNLDFWCLNGVTQISRHDKPINSYGVKRKLSKCGIKRE